MFFVMALGLASRKCPLFPAFLGKYPGDVLWALLVYFAWGFVKQDAPIPRVAAYALATSYLDELSQLYQAPWLNEIRSTAVGHIVFGSAFSWLDMLAYTVGVAIGAGIERIALPSRHAEIESIHAPASCPRKGGGG